MFIILCQLNYNKIIYIIQLKHVSTLIERYHNYVYNNFML